jgi:isopenicillin N synthase-like dioxygenase
MTSLGFDDLSLSLSLLYIYVLKVFFSYCQVKNHGIPEATINNIQSTAMKFFKLPNEERLKFQSIDPTKTIRLTTGFNNKNQKVFVWRESLKFHSYPIEDYEHEWPSNPPSFK